MVEIFVKVIDFGYKNNFQTIMSCDFVSLNSFIFNYAAIHIRQTEITWKIRFYRFFDLEKKNNIFMAKSNWILNNIEITENVKD